MNSKGMSMVMSIMISTVMLISLTGVIFLINYQRQSVFGNLNDTKLAFLAEGGMNLGLGWLKAQTKGAESSLTRFPSTGSKIYKIDGVDVTVLGIKDATTKQWTFTSSATISNRTCEVTASAIVPASPLNDGGGLVFSGGGNNTANVAKIKIGSKDYGLSTTNQMTVMCWVKWNSKNINTDGKTYQWSNIVTNAGTGNGDVGQFWLQHDKDNEHIEFALTNGLGDRRYVMCAKPTEDGGFVDGKWYHVTATYNNDEMKVYANGDYNRWNMKYDPMKTQLDGKKFWAYQVISGEGNGDDGHKKRAWGPNLDGLGGDIQNWRNGVNNAMKKGIKTHEAGYETVIGDWAATGRAFKGRIDDVSIWNRALSADEISNYRVGSAKIDGTEEGLQAYWDFEVSGATNGQTLPNGTAILNKKKIKDANGNWINDTSLNGTVELKGTGTLTYMANSGEQRDDNSATKLVGELKRKWNIKYY